MGSLVDTGLGWYLDEDYLRTSAGASLATVQTGSSGYPAPSEDQPYGGAFRNIPTQSPGFTIAYEPSPGRWFSCWQITNIGSAKVWVGIRPSGWIRACSNVFGTRVMFRYGDQTSWSECSYVPQGGYYFGGMTCENPQNVNPDFFIVDDANLVAKANSSGTVTKNVTKVQGGAGAFAVVSYPHDGNTVYVGVGISSIGIPNSAATVAVDGVHGSYNTFNREGMQFTMFYTEQLTGTLASNVPVVTLDTDISGLPGVYEPRLFLAAADAAQIHVGYAPADEDPYAGGGTSGPGGGTDTDFDITGDTILDSPLPTFSFANSGFARIYNPNLSQLQSLANYLWTDTTFLQTIVNHAKQLLEDPIESIITLNRLPISVPNGTAEVVKVLYIPTNTSMPPVTNQFVDVDCGTLQIKHEYDSALDYNPYTDISLVLPFIGVVQLDPDEVMDKTLSLTYRVDVVSGMCVAKVAVDGCVLYQYSGNCAISMPFNSADFSNYISAMVTAAKSIAGVAAAGAAGAVAAAAEGTDAVKTAVVKALSGESESAMPPLSKSTNMFKETFGKGGLGEGTLKAAKRGVANTVSAVVSSKRTIEHAGHFSGNSGFLGVRRPYAIIKRPRMCNPEEYGKFNGRPCMMYLYLGNLTGYTEVQEIHLTGILATNDELIEIENLLKSGVIM